MSRIVEHEIAPAPQAETWPQPIDLRALSRVEPVPPRFIIPGLPCGYATLLSGHGGIGKTLIVLFMMVCVASGLPFFGLPVERRKVLYLSCEDRESVVHQRLDRICRYLDVDLAALDGHLQILDLVGHDSVLWTPSPGGYTATPAYVELRERMKGADVLVVDGIADVFAGNENSRGDVKQFVNALVATIKPDTGAVVLIGHVAKPSGGGGASSEGYSGSTGWHNSVRARWYLRSEVQRSEDGLSECTGDLILELQKSNLGRADVSMRFRWDDEAHLYIGQIVGGRTPADEQARERREQDGILAALRAVVASPGDYCPSATTGQRTAYHVLSAREGFPDSLKGKANRRRFWRHIEVLRQMQLIREGVIRRANRSEVNVLMPVDPANTEPCTNAHNADVSDSCASVQSAQRTNAPNRAGGTRGSSHTRKTRADDPAPLPNGEGVEL